MLEYHRQKLDMVHLVLLFRVTKLFLISFSYMVKKAGALLRKQIAFYFKNTVQIATGSACV